MARILMVGPDNQVIDRRILQQAESLITRGHAVTVFSGFEAAEEASYIQDGVYIRRFKFDWSDPRAHYAMSRVGRRPGSRYYPQMYIKARQIIALRTGINQFEHFMLRKILSMDFDVLHAHDLPVLNVCLEAGKRRGVPVVFDAHEMYPKQSYLPARVRAQLAAQERRLIKRVAAASTVNEFIADIMASEYGIEKPIVIYNSVPMTEATVRPGLRAELSIPEDARLLIFQGWLSSIRGVDDVIRGVEFMDPSIHFLVVGYGDVLSDLQRLAYDCGVADRVHFTGRVEPEEMLSYTLAADLGVIPYKGVDPNYYYCSPNKLFEFTMAGLPMVASNLPFLARIGRDYGHVHAVNVADPKALAEAVNDILLNPERLRALQSNAVEARNLLHWGHDEERLFAMYERVLAAAGKSSPGEALQSAH